MKRSQSLKLQRKKNTENKPPARSHVYKLVSDSLHYPGVDMADFSTAS